MTEQNSNLSSIIYDVKVYGPVSAGKLHWPEGITPTAGRYLDYFITDTNQNCVLAHSTDLRDIGREIGHHHFENYSNKKITLRAESLPSITFDLFRDEEAERWRPASDRDLENIYQAIVEEMGIVDSIVLDEWAAAGRMMRQEGK